MGICLSEPVKAQPNSDSNKTTVKSIQKDRDNTHKQKSNKIFNQVFEDREEITETSNKIVTSGNGYCPIGLKNIGNTCFMNSILQCIFATAPLTSYFLNDFTTDKRLMRSQKLSQSYCSLLKNSRSTRSTYINPQDLKNAVSKIARQFGGYGQQDAQEFLRFLLDGMHNELNRVSKKPKYKTIDCDKEPIDVQSEIWFNYFRERDNSIITDLFEGQLCSSIQCMKCGYQSLSFDSFMDLSLSIPSVRKHSLDINDCLGNYVDPEKMEKCGYKCTKCKKVDNFQKQMTIFRFPKVLVIHLKRFEKTRHSSGKLTSSISIP